MAQDPGIIVMNSIRRVVQSLRTSSSKSQSQCGLSGAQLFVLQTLRSEGTLVSLSRLAKLTLTHISSVSVVVAKLVEMGLLTKSASKQDSRRMDVGISAKGCAFLKKAPLTAQNALTKALAEFPKKEKEALAGLLQDLITRAGFEDDEPSMFFEESASSLQRNSKRFRKGTNEKLTR